MLSIGCGDIPKVSESHVGLAPWESFPPDASIQYVERFVDDPGLEPRYVALAIYQTDADRERYVAHFGLSPADLPSTEQLSTVQRQLRGSQKNSAAEFVWMKTGGADQFFAYRGYEKGYNASLWIDTANKTMLLERYWY